MSDDKVFAPEQSWLALESRAAQEKDPKLRDLLLQVRDHVRAEISGEIEPLMATLIDDPQYHFRGAMPDVGPKGLQTVRTFYETMISGGGNRFQFDIQRIFVDGGGVVTEGSMRQITSGEAVIAGGVTEVDGEAVDPGARYVAESHILTVWPAGADGRLVGEDIFFGSLPMTRVFRHRD